MTIELQKDRKMKIAKPRKIVAVVIRWSARITAVIGFFFWGAFFLAHLNEWFIQPLFTEIQLPPSKVWICQLLHFGFLVGYIVSFKWELIGGLLVVFSASAFFISIGVLKFLPWTILPGVLFLLCWWLGKLKAKNEADNM